MHEVRQYFQRRYIYSQGVLSVAKERPRLDLEPASKGLRLYSGKDLNQ